MVNTIAIASKNTEIPITLASPGNPLDAAV
jgi:hypothetical protein